LGLTSAADKRDQVNAFIRQSGIYDSVADIPDSTKGGLGDDLHLNRAGYQAMANSIDLGVLAPTR
jgi:lysophospholipase L1-like esterase